jgi:hypothetical protein
MTKCYRSGVFFPIVFVLLAQFIAGADDHIPDRLAHSYRTATVFGPDERLKEQYVYR